MDSDHDHIKVGVIGCGWITKEYNLLSKVIKNTKIVAATDLNIERAQSVGGNDHAYKDINMMFDKEDIDAVYIATPHNLHKKMIKQAFEAGKHVLCEKPVCTTVEEAREIKRLDTKYSNLKLGFNYNYRYDHNCYRLAYGIQNNRLGQVYYANCRVFFSRDEGYFEKGTWRKSMDAAGGGTLIIHGSHLIDIMIWAMGEPSTVMGKVDNVKFDDIEVEDVGFGIVEFENGSYAQINNSSIVKPKMRRIFGDQVELEVFGEKGRCHYKGPWPSKLKWKGVKKYKVDKLLRGFMHFGRSVKAFGKWILEDIPYLNTIDESAKVLCLIKALYKSSETGKKEPIEKL
ncbi:MAG: Gfo/Idh/MocA family oxidoreductase [Promethearchaeia archaeon]